MFVKCMVSLRVTEAGGRYTEVARLVIFGGDVAVQTSAQVNARAERDALTPRIPTITIRVEGADASQVAVTLDGQRVPGVLIGEKQPIDPGAHHIDGMVDTQRVQSDLAIAVGGNARSVLLFKVKPLAAQAQTVTPAAAVTGAAVAAEGHQPESDTEKPAALRTVGIGVGGAGVLFGGITGLLALGKHSDIKKSPNCLGDHCLSDETSTVSSDNSLRTITGNRRFSPRLPENRRRCVGVRSRFRSA